MNRCITIITISASLFCIVPISAYDYKFKNLIEKNIEVQFQLTGGINEPIVTVRVPAKTEVPQNFSGGRAGLCINPYDGNFQVRTLPNGTFKHPLYTASLLDDNQYQQFLKTKKLPALGKCEISAMSMEEKASRCNVSHITCGSILEFSETSDGYPVVKVSSYF